MNTWILILASLVLAPAHSQATSLETFWRNQQGISKFKAKSYYPAYQSFLQALESDPLNPLVQLNLGATFEANEEYEKAEHAYKGALLLLPEPSELRFQTLFNLGGVLGKQSHLDEALDAYQAALEIHPDSKEVKTNIELLFQNGGGQGQGKNQDQKDQQGKDKKPSTDGQKDDKEKKQDPQNEPQKKQPRPFQSQELSPQDVKKILDEIKNQEQSIRAQEYERNVKDAPRGKDW